MHMSSKRIFGQNIYDSPLIIDLASLFVTLIFEPDNIKYWNRFHLKGSFEPHHL
jgi:hypothetical protein